MGIDAYGSNTMPFALREPYQYIEKKFLQNISSKKILDFCCGTGIYSIYPALQGAQIEGVDISRKSIDVSKARAEHFNVSNNCNFRVMDGEQLDYAENSFDIVLIYGSLSYLNIEKIYRDLSKIIKPGGQLIVIDSLGHNPIFNINRRRNIKNWSSIRTDTKRLETMKRKDVVLAQRYFKTTEIRCFNLITAGLFFINKVLGTNFQPRILFSFDNILMRTPLIRWLAFKVVFVCQKED